MFNRTGSGGQSAPLPLCLLELLGSWPGGKRSTPARPSHWPQTGEGVREEIEPRRDPGAHQGALGHCLFPHRSPSHHHSKMEPLLETEDGVTVICSPNPPFSLLAQILKCPGIFPHGMGETTRPSWKGIALLDTLLDRNTFCGVTCNAPGDVRLCHMSSTGVNVHENYML